MVSEKCLGLGDQGGEVVEMQGLLAQEVTEGLTGGGVKGLKAEVEAQLLLVCRHRGLALGIHLNCRGRKGEFAGDKSQHIWEQFQGLLARKAAGESQKGHLIRQAQTIVGAPTERDLAMISGRKHDALGNEFARVRNGLQHRIVLQMTWGPHGRYAPQQCGSTTGACRGQRGMNDAAHYKGVKGEVSPGRKA